MKTNISADQAGVRLDKYLTAQLGKTRSKIQKMIKAGVVLINGRAVSAHYLIKENDTFEIKETSGENKKAEINSALPDFEIIDETENYLVINKPAGLLMHGTPELRGDNLADLLAARWPCLTKVGDDPFRPGIVHRIDKEVSGLVLVAKNQNFFEFAKEQFQKRAVRKSYTALAHGRIRADRGAIDFPIERAAAGHKMAAKPIGSDGRRAESEFSVIGRWLHFTLVKVAIKTGRTHQIRAHLAAFGHPLVGDNLYGTRAAKEMNKKLGTARVYLVANELGFTDLGGEKKQYRLALPEGFNSLFNKLK